MQIHRSIPFLLFVSLGAAFSPLAAQESVRPEVHEITVEGEVVPDYTAADAITATKTDTPLLETPQTINVVTRQLLDDQAVVTLSEALRNVGGVNVSGTYRDFDIYSIRGFFGTGYTYLDGLALDRQVTFQRNSSGSSGWKWCRARPRFCSGKILPAAS